MSSVSTHSHVTNLSGNEIYCLNKLSFTPGNICIGNSVFALGILGSLTAGLNILVGGEIPQVTSLIHDGRINAIGTAVKNGGHYNQDREFNSTGDHQRPGHLL